MYYGFNIKNGYFDFTPKKIKDWNEYSFKYKYGSSIYNVLYKFDENKESLKSKYLDDFNNIMRNNNNLNNNLNIVDFDEYFKSNPIVIINDNIVLDKIKLNSNGGIFNITIYN